MVALNYQTLDLSTILNDGKFDENGRTGFVLKPAFLRKGITPLSLPVTPLAVSSSSSSAAAAASAC